MQLPEPEQVVEVRRRRFVVRDVVGTASRAFAEIPSRTNHHVVRLSSIEEDAFGDELEVIWEVEPGARVVESAKLPEPREFDEPVRLDAFLDAVRWGTFQSADANTLQSPFRAGIVIEDYQLDPVARAIQMPRVNLLIADDVGLGKTIEAGLVAEELILRQRVHSIFVIVPAPLQIKWRDEMRDRFGLEFRIIDSTSLRELRRRRGVHVNPWTHFPRLITSIDFLKRDRVLRTLKDCLPPPGKSVYPRRFDLMIVDEAHNVAPSGRGRYATDSQRTHTVRTLVPHFENKLFLTATPHNGYSESFSALLELLDDQRFARDVTPSETQLATVMVHRLKSDLVDDQGKPRFPERCIEAIEVSHVDEEREAHRWLQRYVSLRKEAVETGSQRVATEFVTKMLKKRLFSSPAAFRSTLERHVRTLRGLGEEYEQLHQVRESVLRAQLSRIDDPDLDDDDLYEIAVDEDVATATSAFDDLSQEERDLLGRMDDWAEMAASRPDSKATRLIEWLTATLRPSGNWNDERVIVFTEYRATQNWLVELLAGRRFVRDGRVEMIYGGMDPNERERIKAAFQAKPGDAPVRILIATDTASEGIDLQNWCHRLVHYDIPWNPNRLEQRNGRIDRHGQRADRVLVHHFVGAGWNSDAAVARRPGDLDGDLEFLMHAALRVNAIRRDLGKVGPVIADQVERAMLGDRTTLDTRTAEREAEPVRQMLRVERDIREKIARLREQLETSKSSLRISPENVESVVRMGLDVARQPNLGPPIEDERIDGRGRVFEIPNLRGGWARCLDGLAHPHTGAIRPITFDHELAEGRDDVVLVHLNHPLVQMSQRILRAEIWAPEELMSLNRVSARRAQGTNIVGYGVVAHARLLLTGGNNYRLHEEVISVGGIVTSGRFRRLNVGETRDLLNASSTEQCSDAALDLIRGDWSRVGDALARALESRRNDRERSLDGVLRRRAKAEIDASRIVLEELRDSIRAALDAKPPAQFDLFDVDERQQFERNRDSLSARLEAIPGDIEAERARLEERFSDRKAYQFPVAVTFVVSEDLAGSG